MKLYATTTSERASKGQGGNRNIIVEFTVQDGNEYKKIGEVELYYNNDTILDKDVEFDEWTLSFRLGDDPEVDPEIIAQGHVRPNSKGEKKKDEKEMTCWYCGLEGTDQEILDHKCSTSNI